MDLHTLKKTIREYDFRPKKRLGQNFLIDRSVASRIASTFEDPKSPVIEIGGGFGALTELLAERFERLTVFETDAVLYRFLSKSFQERKNASIEKKDILDVSFQNYLRFPEEKVYVIGNLPYAITSPILVHLIEQRDFIREALITVQREVSQRLRAKPRTKAYSPLSCLLQCFTQIIPEFKISKSAFYPHPKVDSEVVRLRFLEKPAVSPKDLNFMTRVIRTGFGKRRKVLANALTDLGENYSKEKILETLKELGFSGKARAEELELKDFAKLSDKLQALTFCQK